MENSDATAWPDEQKQQKQNEDKNHGKLASIPSVSRTFKCGSYRRYMNHLIRSNFSEKLHFNFPLKALNRAQSDNLLSVCSNEYKSNNSEAGRQPVSNVTGGNNENYVISNSKINFTRDRAMSLASLTEPSGAARSASSTETDGGVVVDNKGDAPLAVPRSRAGAHAEVKRTVCENCNTREVNKGRQRKTGAIAINTSRLEKPRAEGAVAASHVERLIHKYTALIAEQEERALAGRRRPSLRRDLPARGIVLSASELLHMYDSSTTNPEPSQPGADTAGQAGLQSLFESCNSIKASPTQIDVSTRRQHNDKLDHVMVPAASNQEHLNGSDNVLQYDNSYKTLEISSISAHVQQADLIHQHANNSPDSEGLRDFIGKSPNDKTAFSNQSSLFADKLLGKDVSKPEKINFASGNLKRQHTCDLNNLKHLGCSCEDILEKPTQSDLNSVNVTQARNLENSEDPEHNNFTELQTECVVGNYKSKSNQNAPIGVGNCENYNDEISKVPSLYNCGAEDELDSRHKQVIESTPVFIEQSTDLRENMSPIGGTGVPPVTDVTNEGNRLLLPRAASRATSPAISSSASDEGCSVAPPLESSLTPCSSEDDILKKAEGKPGAAWAWPVLTSDQDSEGQDHLPRNDHGRCGSSDSAVCLLPNDEEGRILKESGNRQTSLDSDILDLISEDPSCDKTMLLDRYMRKNSHLSDDFDNSRYCWSDSGTRRDSDVFESVSRQNSVDLGRRRDVWLEEMRNTKEAVCDDVCDSGIDRDAFLASAGESCWDVSSTEAKNDDGFNLDSDRNRFRPSLDLGHPDDGFAFRHRPRQFRKLTSMISCESGVGEDEDCSRKSSAAEPGENAEEDDYPVELRRQSTQSYQTDDDDSSANHSYRYWRTPSVVVSDYSDDVPYFTSLTLEELEQLKYDEVLQQPRDLSSSECGSGASSVSGSVNFCALDAEYALRTPERKASDCSTCSTLSGDEDASCDALLQPVRTKEKVGLTF